MKKLIATTAALGLVAVSVFAQGTINFANNVTGVLQARIYAPELANTNLSIVGNTSTGNPAGSTVYTGALLSGTGYMVQLFAANGSGQAEGSLTAQSLSSFRTGSAAGIWTSVTATLTGIAADASAGTFQVRVWDNVSGLYSTWASAQTAWNAGTIAAGKSSLLSINSIGGNVNTPPNLTGLTSFNIYYVPVPEPTTMALIALGGASLVLFRRRK
jgi:hypothetical protein